MDDIKQDALEKIQEALKNDTLEVRTLEQMKTPGYVADYSKLFNECVQLMLSNRGTELKVVLPVDEFSNTKKNRIRLDPKDKTSPMGVVLKGDAFVQTRFHPCAACRFTLTEVVQWLGTKVSAEVTVDDKAE